ncbi:DegT/DnrJ/EryC1/StrS aminotransferase family protein [Sphingomonas cavernae]|uniref:DegT/DnrJ/EryC1/StrS aminotransferase family protein n=1 Tax=Sphingomonas cavernae TaxID=2320861 RepID=A0A418WSK0_9SPHN|nr:DegT/DnrJ/EryC1/StrS aminotransferase family protein [Sphingomonas cavernae]
MPHLRSAIRSHWPVYADDEIEAVVEILRSGRVNALHHGEHCQAFEEAFATMCGMPHAIALANGTLALELALRALGIGPGDEVIVPARTFIASASCVIACGATPIFADVDPDTQNLNAETVAAVMTPRTRAIVAVHLAGYPCPMDELIVLSDSYGIKIVEDCAQAHGARFNGRPVGSFGDAAVFSFCTDKIISTGGEGGMLLLRDDAVWSRAWSYKDHGKSHALTMGQTPGAAFKWLHESFGSNYRMTEMQAAIGLRQLEKLPSWLADRANHAKILDDALSGLAAVRLIPPPEGISPAYYKYYAFIRPEWLSPGWSRDAIIGAAIDAGLPCQSGICPEIYREQAFVRAGLGPESPRPTALRLGQTSLMLPIDQTLDEDMVSEMGNVLREIIVMATAEERAA